jgi:hypothetical protein
VIATFPVADGVPFPTLYWLTCQRAVRVIGRLESEGRMRELNERLRVERPLADALDAAQRDYVERRDALHRLPDAGGIGGGPLDRVKCLHAHYAHHLVCGCNPIGEWIEEQAGTFLHPPPCIDAG